LFDLQKSIRWLSRQAAGTLYNEEALDVKEGFGPVLFVPLEQTNRAPFSCF
jgi:hypothetical protein